MVLAAVSRRPPASRLRCRSSPSTALRIVRGTLSLSKRGEIITFVKPAMRRAMPLFASSLPHSAAASLRPPPHERLLNSDTSSLTPTRTGADGPAASVIGPITVPPGLSRAAGVTVATHYSPFAKPA